MAALQAEAKAPIYFGGTAFIVAGSKAWNRLAFTKKDAVKVLRIYQMICPFSPQQL